MTNKIKGDSMARNIKDNQEGIGKCIIFDLKSAEDYFYHIQRSIDKYKLDSNKKIERLFFIINGLNHLREWIAPNYQPYFNNGEENKPKTKEEIVSKKIYDLSEHEIIRKICNGTKHQSKQKHELIAKYDLKISQWDSVSDVRKISNGSPSAFYVDGKNIINIIDIVADFYEKQWFESKKRLIK